jgi:hypothetical protein
MSEARSISYMNRAVEIFNENESLTAAEKALILASLAQVEATLEVVDRLKNGLRIPGIEEHTRALDHLAARLPER